jgi:two-component system, OmpR family, KDP operon response regulator KdpE
MTEPVNTVLIVDDEPKIRRFLRAGFELNGYAVIESGTGADALRDALFHAPDLIILDLSLPDVKGDEILEQVRSWSNIPVIILSVQSSEAEKVRLLNAGADDYVVKPFGITELLARTEVALRRFFRSRHESPVVVAGPLRINLVSRTVTSENNRIKLTRMEDKLLHVLASNSGLVVTHEQLLKEIWGGNPRENIQYLRILVRKLRRKIENDPNRPQLLVTESGIGYRLMSKFAEPPATPATPQPDR